MTIKRVFISLSVLVLLFAVPAAAGASSSAQSGYEESAPLSAVSEAGDSGPGQATSPAPTAAESGSSSVLPFTGLQLAIVLLLGLGLLGVGILVRRASHSASL
jgi:hypothetical protein